MATPNELLAARFPEEARAEVRPWSRRRWFWTSFSIFAGQLFFIFFLSNQKLSTTVQEERGSPLVRFLPKPYREIDLPEPWRMDNPRLFAAANTFGFSGSAWMLPPVRNYQPPDATPSPQILELPQVGLSDVLYRLGQMNVANPDSGLLGTIPAAVLLPMPPTAEPPGPSRLRIEPVSIARSLRGAIVPPVEVSSEVLSNTVVQVVIDSDGWVQSARLLSGSGSKKADQDGLNLARAARFNDPRAALPPGPSFASLTFEWTSIPPEAPTAPASSP